MGHRLRMVVVVIAAVWLAERAAGQSEDYCRFTSRHTLCKSSGLGSKCGNQMQKRGVERRDASDIVAQHNLLRSRVATGKENRGDGGAQPAASNMRLMEWDDELARVAQGHADQCVFKHDCADCRRVSRFGVGQNLFISFQSNFETSVQWERAIQAWYDEVAEFNPNRIQPFQFSSGVGHYTQMLWWSTYKIGCGFIMFKEGKWWKKLYTCNYGPAGNILFSTMYSKGSPCSSCPDGTTCSAQYPGLCQGSRFRLSVPTNQVLVRRTGFSTTSFPKSRGKTMEAAPADPEQPDADAMFVPFTGSQPTTNDLMAFLKRTGTNTQLIRTSSLGNVRNIIASLPDGQKPIVLFRSGSGQLTELNPETLAPLQRSVRSTTTRGPGRSPHPVLLTCDLNFSPCNVIHIGGNWTLAESESEGQYMKATLEEGEGAQVVLQELVDAPTSQAVCVALSHRRELTGDHAANATIPPLQVGVMPLGKTMTRRPLLGAPGMWEMSRVTLQDIHTSFMLTITVGPASAPATVDLDALMVTDGVCCASGEC